MDLGIEGKVALVVAGSRGLGRATAEALAGEGARVMVSSRDEDILAEAASCSRSPGPRWRPRWRDITDPGTPARLVAATVEAFGTVDIVIANAGGPPPGRALDVDDDRARRRRSTPTCCRRSA